MTALTRAILLTVLLAVDGAIGEWSNESHRSPRGCWHAIIGDMTGPLQSLQRPGIADKIPQVQVPLQPGELIDGKYLVEELLGQGGMGAVVAAHHPGLDQRVAVKLMLPKALVIPNAAERFVREWHILSELRSYHIPRVLDVGRHDGLPFIVMEYLHGIDMSELLDKCFHLRVSEATAFMIQACHAIYEAHAKGIIHRDLKPSNLFLTLEGDGTASLKVLDFGLSKLTGKNAGSKLQTTTVGTMGSPAYMSPEQAKSAKHVDERSDIWSLGAILYHLTTGELPFQAESSAETLALVLYENPAPMNELASWIPAELEAVVMRCLDKDPDRRYQNALELADALLPFAREQEDGVEVETVRRPSGHTSARVVYRPQAISRIFPHVVPTASYHVGVDSSYPEPDMLAEPPTDLDAPSYDEIHDTDPTTVRRATLSDDTGITTVRQLEQQGERRGRWAFPIALALAFFVAISLTFWWPTQWSSSADSAGEPPPPRAGKQSNRPMTDEEAIRLEVTPRSPEASRTSASGDNPLDEPLSSDGSHDAARADDEEAEPDDDAAKRPGTTSARSKKRAKKRRRSRARSDRRRNKKRSGKVEPAEKTPEPEKASKPSKDNPFPDIF